MTSNKNDNLNINSPIQSESYLSILQRENATLVKNLQEQTEIANNLKGQVEEKEKEKNALLKSIESQDNKISENTKILSELKNQINELKEQIKKKQEEKNNNIIKLNNEKEDLIKDNENQGKNIDELKGKISNLENEIKKKRENKSTIEGQDEKKK
jgi:chromosome segregation ATPase